MKAKEKQGWLHLSRRLSSFFELSDLSDLVQSVSKVAPAWNTGFINVTILLDYYGIHTRECNIFTVEYAYKTY